MEKINLEELPNRKDLIGKKINVRRQGGKFHYEYQDRPMMRIFRGAKITKERGDTFCTWYWTPEFDDSIPNVTHGIDCGYSGIALNTEYSKGSFLSA